MGARWVAAVAGLGACGNPLVTGDYRGERLARIEGSVLMDGTSFDWDDSDLRVALFWANDHGFAEQDVVVTTAFPARYTLDLYHPPPEHVRFDAEWSASRVAAAIPTLYIDSDGNGAWSEEEEVVGGSPDIALVWSDPDHKGSEREGFIDVQPGFQTMWTERACDSEQLSSQTAFWPADDFPVDLWVGPIWKWLTDWDCDGGVEEWDEICPPDEACDDAF